MRAADADSSDEDEFHLDTDANGQEDMDDTYVILPDMAQPDGQNSQPTLEQEQETQVDGTDDTCVKLLDMASPEDQNSQPTPKQEQETQVDGTDDTCVKLPDIASPEDQNSQPVLGQETKVVDRSDVIRKNKSTYEGDMENGRKNGIGTLSDESREQYVRGLFKDDILVELHFAQFYHNNSQDDVIRFYGLDNLVTSSKDHYVARFYKTSFNIECENFPSILDAIHKRIVISKILDDDLKNDLERIRETFSRMLNYKKNTIASVFTSQRDMFQLYLIMKEMPQYYDYEKENKNIVVLSKIYKNKLISNEVRNQAKEVCMAEKRVFIRNKSLPVMKLGEVDFSWMIFLTELNGNGIRRFKSALAKCLPSIPLAFEQIDNLQDQKLFTVRISDIELFKDLETTSKQHSTTELGFINFHDFTKEYISGLWNLMVRNIIENSSEKDIPNKSKYTNDCFLQVFKTFLELLDTVCKEKNVQVANMIQIKENFDLSVEIKDDIGLYGHRIKFLVDLLNNFKPGDMKKFRYDFAFFKEKESIGTWLKNIKKHVINYLDNLSNIDEKNVIWHYYIHNTYSYLLTTLSIKVDEQNNDITIFLNSLMSLFKTVIQNSDLSPEKVRILSNGLIKFAITISPNFELNLKDADKTLAWKQADYLKDYVTKNEQSLDDITNIVDIYQVFWEERQILFKYNDVYHKLDTWVKFVEEINLFMEFVFELNIYNNQFLIFLRSVNEFIRLISGTDFSWYINRSFYETINCKYLIKVINETYLVEKPKEFLEKISGYPKHYLMQVGLQFLSCTKLFLQNCEWSEKIEASSNLLLLMGTSLINFKKLPSAVDFDKFFAEFTQPFERVTRNSTDSADFKRRLASLDNYYKYTLELNVMGVEKALNLFNKNEISPLDYSFHSDILKDCYKVYIEKFNKFVEKYILQNNVEELISHVKSKAKRDIKDIDNWDSYYKKVKLPKILAGVSAVWSALESTDIINKSEGIKPHVIQILCIFRLLGADQSQHGFPNHLAQVLTGQGKSIVLGLLSATLAITGNRVRIVCYNEYLVKRDAQQFKIFYSTLNVENLIIYGTFRDMANEITSPNLKGKSYTLRNFVELLLKNELPIMNTEEEKVSSKTVLLLDEVDVFFTPQFYGNTYNPGTKYFSEDLAKLQREIWNETSSVRYEDDVAVKEKEINEKIQTFINDLLIETDDEVFKYIVTNTNTFFNRHLEEMIRNAINVRKAKPGDWYYKTFKLLPTGKIVIKDYYGKETNDWFAYKNIFMYFKLKKTDFDHQGLVNYGYLSIACGNISYAMLPNNYHAILGVSGTLQQLFPFEMRAVKSYGISSASDMPTFFGSRKLCETNFSIVEKEDAWISAILDSVWHVINEGRAVIVFFVDESMIERYRGKFESNLSRYMVLTGNEEADEVARMIEEAGVAKRITIATRGMGRGVDFQSNDSSVETKGGIHVIQTFFSDDVKEETQIKGRTARKDNRGSYESILCREHLSSANYSSSADTYEKLTKERDEKAQQIGTELEKEIEKSEKKHKDTMEFLKMFYTYNPANRSAFFQRYPLLELDE